MKVIGKDERGNYIAIVTHRELEKAFNKFYTREDLKKLEIGQEFDLGLAHDFHSNIVSACEAMTNASKKFGEVQSTMFAFAQMTAKAQIDDTKEPA